MAGLLQSNPAFLHAKPPIKLILKQWKLNKPIGLKRITAFCKEYHYLNIKTRGFYCFKMSSFLSYLQK